MTLTDPSQPCPCTSGTSLAACCGRYLAGNARPPDAVSLMRSRYTAFCLADTGWLWRTLHPSHEDRHRPEAEVLAALARACKRFKYRGLWILDHAAPAPGRAQVLFMVKLYESGKDRSFVERSEFLDDGQGWAYASGLMRPVRSVAGDPKALRLATFEAVNVGR